MEAGLARLLLKACTTLLSAVIIHLAAVLGSKSDLLCTDKNNIYESQNDPVSSEPAAPEPQPEERGHSSPRAAGPPQQLRDPQHPNSQHPGTCTIHAALTLCMSLNTHSLQIHTTATLIPRRGMQNIFDVLNTVSAFCTTFGTGSTMWLKQIIVLFGTNNEYG